MKNLKYLGLVLAMGIALVGCNNQTPNKTETVEKAESETKIEKTRVFELGVLDVDRAMEIALEDANLKESDVQFTKKEYDSVGDDYEIEFIYDGKEYEYEIKSDGTIKEIDLDDVDYDYSKENVIPADEAKEIALKKAGVSENDIKYFELELDNDDGKIIYEISFDVGDTEYEYDIDAITGEILEEEID